MMMATVTMCRKHLQRAHTVGPGIISFNLELLFFKTVLEGHENGAFFAVLQEGDDSIAVHALTGEELEILEARQDVLHHDVAVGFEDFDLVWCVLFEFGCDSAKKIDFRDVELITDSTAFGKVDACEIRQVMITPWKRQ